MTLTFVGMERFYATGPQSRSAASVGEAGVGEAAAGAER
jgi:hypothetical protein